MTLGGPLLWLLISLDLAPAKPMVGYLYQGIHQGVQQGDDVMSEVTSLRLWNQKAQSVQAAPGRMLGWAAGLAAAQTRAGGATGAPGMCWVLSAQQPRHTRRAQAFALA